MHSKRYSSTIRKFDKKTLIRERLFQRLDKNGESNGIWAYGPVGSGKTTLIDTYLQNRKLPSLLLEIGPSDSRIERFFANVAKAAKESELNCLLRPAKAVPGGDEVAKTAAFGRQYFQQLYSQIHEPAVLIFENLERLDDQSPSYVALRSAFEVLPEHINIIFSSRNKPNKYFVRYFADGQLAVLDQKDLCFTSAEIGELISMEKNSRFPDNIAKVIYKRTNGWTAGVLMWLQSLKDHGGELNRMDQFSPGPAFDYIEAELFDPMPKKDQEILLLTGILPKIAPDLMHELFSDHNAHESIGRVFSNQLMTYKSQDEIYELNPLMREFILQKAQKTLNKTKLQQILCKAIDLLLAKGHFQDAVNLYVQFSEQDNIKQVFIKCIKGELLNCRHLSIKKILPLLPDALILHDPWLQLAQDVCHQSSDPQKQLPQLEKIYQVFQDIDDKDGRLVVINALFESAAALLVSLTSDEFNAWIKKIPLSDLQKNRHCHEKIKSRLIKNTMFLLVTRRPTHSLLKKLAHLAMKKVQTCKSLEAKKYLSRALAWKDLVLGDLPEAKYYYDISNDTIESPTASPCWKIDTDLWESIYFLTAGQFEKGGKAGARGEQTARSNGFGDLSLLLLFCRVAGDLGVENLEGAQKKLDGLAVSAQELPALHGFIYHTLCFWHALVGDQKSLTDAHAQNARKCAQALDSPFAIAGARILAALASYRSARLDAAGREIEAALKTSRKMGAKNIEYACRLINALIRLDDGAAPKAPDDLKKAMGLAKRLGYLNGGIWRKQAMARLCRKALETGIEVEYTQQLIRNAGLMHNMSDSNVKEHWPWPIKIYVYNRFSIIIDDIAVNISGRITTPINLLKAMIMMGCRERISATDLQKMFWPEARATDAAKSLKMNLHRLRKILGYHNAVFISDGSVGLNPSMCWVDVWELEDRLADVEKAWAQCRESKHHQGLAVRLTNEFLQKWLSNRTLLEGDLSCSVSFRAQLTKRCLGCLKQLADTYEKSFKYMEVINAYNKAMTIFPDEGDIYYQLIRFYSLAGLRTMALNTYALYKEMVSVRFGGKLSEQIQSLMKRVVSSPKQIDPRPLYVTCP